MNENLYMIADLLYSLQVNRSMSLIISALSIHKELTSKELQNMLEMTQSEISITVNNLSEKELITYRKSKERSTTMVRSYSLILSLPQIIEKLEKKHLSEQQMKLNILHDLKIILLQNN